MDDRRTGVLLQFDGRWRLLRQQLIVEGTTHSDTLLNLHSARTQCPCSSSKIKSQMIVRLLFTTKKAQTITAPHTWPFISNLKIPQPEIPNLKTVFLRRDQVKTTAYSVPINGLCLSQPESAPTADYARWESNRHALNTCVKTLKIKKT